MPLFGVPQGRAAGRGAQPTSLLPFCWDGERARLGPECWGPVFHTLWLH